MWVTEGTQFTVAGQKSTKDYSYKLTKSHNVSRGRVIVWITRQCKPSLGYYNHKRLKGKLKGLSPVKYRELQSSRIA